MSPIESLVNQATDVEAFAAVESDTGCFRPHTDDCCQSCMPSKILAVDRNHDMHCQLLDCVTTTQKESYLLETRNLTGKKINIAGAAWSDMGIAISRLESIGGD
jgi:hypothetical protein